MNSSTVTGDCIPGLDSTITSACTREVQQYKSDAVVIIVYDGWIAAARATERLQQLLKLQAKAIPKGQMPLKCTQEANLLPRVTLNQIRIIEHTWDYFVKFMDYCGVDILIRLFEKNSNLLKLFPKLYTGTKRRSYHYLRSNQTAIKYGRSLIMHITDIVSNLQNNATLENYIKHKFNILHDAGFDYDEIKNYQDIMLVYVEESMSSQWSPAATTAWREMTNSAITIGTQSWTKTVPGARLTIVRTNKKTSSSFPLAVAFEAQSLVSRASSNW